MKNTFINAIRDDLAYELTRIEVNKNEDLNPEECIDTINDCMLRLNNFTLTDLFKLDDVNEARAKADNMISNINSATDAMLVFNSIMTGMIHGIIMKKELNE